MITFAAQLRIQKVQAYGNAYNTVYTNPSFVEVLATESYPVTIDCTGILQTGESITFSSASISETIRVASTGFSIPLASQLYNTHLYNSGAKWGAGSNMSSTSVTITITGTLLLVGQKYNAIVQVTTSQGRKISIVLGVQCTFQTQTTASVPSILSFAAQDSPTVAMDFTNYMISNDALVTPIVATVYELTGQTVSGALASSVISGNTVQVTFAANILVANKRYVLLVTGTLNHDKIMGTTTLIQVLS